VSLGGDYESITIVDGVVNITSKTGSTGSINNTTIGSTTPASGTFTTLSASTAVNLSPTGSVTINPSSLGSINNVNIGISTPGSAQFTTLTANTGTITNLSGNSATITSITSTGTQNLNNIIATSITVNNITVSNDVTADNIILNNDPTIPTHAARKSYVDATVTALAIALGG
jgi:molecular chaperone DnaK (HSP70)